MDINKKGVERKEAKIKLETELKGHEDKLIHI